VIDEILMDAAQFRSDGQDLRRKARKEESTAVRNQLFDAAAAEFQKAITTLERGLRTVRRQQDGYTRDVCRVLEALSQSYGSMGGTRRDAGDRLEAQKQYEKGNEYEEERRQHCGAKDTYNLLQRLVIRALIAPDCVKEDGFLKEINGVREEIERQVNSGRDDSWALADLALARFLAGFEADLAIGDLDRRNAEATFYESAYNAVAALVDEGLGKDKPLGERLEVFKRLLQRKGGIK
jgi:hypothetical protein